MISKNFVEYLQVNSEDISQGESELISLKLAVSHTTTATDIIPVLLKRLKQNNDAAGQFKLKQNDKSENLLHQSKTLVIFFIKDYL